jgi:aspartate aminotransferase-like enzyme
MRFEKLEFEWGHPLDMDAVHRALGSGTPGWVWCVHCETSTGVLNDVGALLNECRETGVRLYLDSVSSIGTVPVDLSGVHMASCSSGKGLRGYPGLSMVFHNHPVAPRPDCLPRYLDLGYYSEQQGVPFTFSSNLLHALHAAVRHVDWEKRFADISELSRFLRAKLSEFELRLIGTAETSSPAVFTIAVPEGTSSVKIGELMRDAGFLLSYNSDYLRKKNWIQVCLMGECTQEKAVSLVNALGRVWLHRRNPQVKPAAAS